EEEEVPVGPRDGDRARIGRGLELKVLLHERGQQADGDQHHDGDDRVGPEGVREERVGLVGGHIVSEVVAGVAHEDREQRQADQDGVEDVVGADGEALPLGFERVPDVTVELADLELARRRGDGGAGSFFLDLFLAHIGSEIPCARMKRKWTYIKSTISAGSTNTCSVKKRCSVGGPTTAPPCNTSLLKVPSHIGSAD